MRQNSGLTVIELLVIIAIIAVLAATLLPVISAARNAARKSACASNLLQIGKAIKQYARDNSGRVPPAQYYSGHASSPKGMSYVDPPAWSPSTPDELKRLYPGLWQGRIRGYLKSSKLLVCPATTRAMRDNSYFYLPRARGAPADYEYPYSTYGMNWRFSNGGALGGDPTNPVNEYIGVIQTLESPPVPSRAVLLIETQQRIEWLGAVDRNPYPGHKLAGGNVTPFGDWGEFFWAIRWLDDPWVPFGHSGGCNLVLADGHVKYVKAPPPPYPPAASHIEKLGLKWW